MIALAEFEDTFIGNIYLDLLIPLPSYMLLCLSYWQWHSFAVASFFFFPWMSSNQANDYGSLRVKQLKVKFTGRLKLSDYPCYGNLTNSSTE